MIDDEPELKYYAVRYLELFCIALFIFGMLWEGTERFNLSTPQFMMMYGGMGALVTEALARIFSKKKTKEEEVAEVKHG